VYEKRKALLGENDRDTLNALSLLSDYLESDEETLKINEKIYEMRKASFGEEDGQTLYSPNYLGDSYNYLGDNKKAKEYHQTAYEKKEDNSRRRRS
ncbi:MAG: hypothetical protein IKD94_00235, partial [Erysipelotrichaceae bacterium]|nr:hypothetical protein [Erysipelotrichaceae bacterium]